NMVQLSVFAHDGHAAYSWHADQYFRRAYHLVQPPLSRVSKRASFIYAPHRHDGRRTYGQPVTAVGTDVVLAHILLSGRTVFAPRSADDGEQSGIGRSLHVNIYKWSLPR